MILSQDQIIKLSEKGWHITQFSDDLFCLSTHLSWDHYQRINDYLKGYSSNRYYETDMVEIIMSCELLEYQVIYVFSPNFIDTMNNMHVPRQDWDKMLRISVELEPDNDFISIEKIACDKNLLQICDHLTRNHIIYRQYTRKTYYIRLTIRGTVSKIAYNDLITILCDRNF